MDLLFILIAKYLFVLPIVIGGIYFLLQSLQVKKQMILFAAIALPIIGIVAFTGNHLYSDPRPFVVDNFSPLIPHAADNGFPSDHTLLVSVVATIVYFFNRRIGIVLGVTAILVGMARIYVGLHHPVDVLGSMVMAGIGGIAAFQVLKRMPAKYKKSQHRPRLPKGSNPL